MSLIDNRRVLIACVNYKRASDTISCLASIECLNLEGVQLYVAVCDNSPTVTGDSIKDALSEKMHVIEEHTSGTTVYSSKTSSIKVVIHPSKENLGFAGGNNTCITVGIQFFGEFDYVWLLNNDTEVDPDCLLSMLEAFKGGRKIGACGSTMVYYHDKVTVQALGGSTYEPWSGTMREIGNGLKWPAVVDEDEVNAKMAYVCGASMLVSNSFIRDVGLMNEEYFLFFEEIDWCERGRRKGYAYAYARDAVVYHKEGAAIGTGTGARRSLLAEYYGMRNKLLVTWRFFPWAFLSVWTIGWLQVARRALQGRRANAWLMAKVLCGLGKRPV